MLLYSCQRQAADVRLLSGGTDTEPPEQLPDLGRNLTVWQSGQAAPQASNYHWIAGWHVLSPACTNFNI